MPEFFYFLDAITAWFFWNMVIVCPDDAWVLHWVFNAVETVFPLPDFGALSYMGFL